MRRRVVACLGAVAILSAVLPAARAHAVVLPGGCQDVRATGATHLAGETVTVWAYERLCGPRVTLDDVAITSMGVRPYTAVVEVLRGGRIVSTATDGVRAVDHVVWLSRSGVGISVRVVVRAGGEKGEVTMGDG